MNESFLEWLEKFTIAIRFNEITGLESLPR